MVLKRRSTVAALFVATLSIALLSAPVEAAPVSARSPSSPHTPAQHPPQPDQPLPPTGRIQLRSPKHKDTNAVPESVKVLDSIQSAHNDNDKNSKTTWYNFYNHRNNGGRQHRRPILRNDGHAVLDEEDDDAGNEMLDTEEDCAFVRPDEDETIEGQAIEEEDEDEDEENLVLVTGQKQQQQILMEAPQESPQAHFNSEDEIEDWMIEKEQEFRRVEEAFDEEDEILERMDTTELVPELFEEEEDVVVVVASRAAFKKRDVAAAAAAAVVEEKEAVKVVIQSRELYLRSRFGGQKAAAEAIAAAET